MKNRIEIQEYIPDNHLVLNITNHSDNRRYASLLYGLILFLALLFLVIFKSILPFLLVIGFVIFWIQNKPKLFLKRAIFSTDELRRVYHTPLFNWTNQSIP